MTKSMLDRIVLNTREALSQRMRESSLASLRDQALQAAPPRGFEACLKGKGINVIAEIKRASPSKGWFNPFLDAGDQARSYARGGAAAVSVLTEPTFFHGSMADMETVRRAVDLPVLCKGFVLDPYQLYEARLHGADAALFIVAILDSDSLSELMLTCHRLGMSAVVEVHDEQELEEALKAKARLVGINNRDLTDFTVDMNTTFRLRPLLPDSVTVISESGIVTRSDVEVLEQTGVDAVLVGEILVRVDDPAAKIRELLGL